MFFCGDFHCFISGAYYVILDQSQWCSWKINFVQHSNYLLHHCQDIFTPFMNLFDFNPQQPFSGTLFRISQETERTKPSFRKSTIE